MQLLSGATAEVRLLLRFVDLLELVVQALYLVSCHQSIGLRVLLGQALLPHIENFRLAF